jgi:4'-phosphopantetheinyl transferase EntD
MVPNQDTDSMLLEIVPSAVASIEKFGPFAGSLLGCEENAVLHAIPGRRMEFAAGRRCAREALAQIGVPPQPIPRGAAREPLWPGGVIGSITHCPGYCAAAVARSYAFSAIGIDAERNEPLPFEALSIVADDHEQSQIREHSRCGIHWDRLLFSAKESVFKAFYPLHRRWLGFEGVSIRLIPGEHAFEARIPAGIEAGRAVETARILWGGRYAANDQHLVTAVVVPV